MYSEVKVSLCSLWMMLVFPTAWLPSSTTLCFAAGERETTALGEVGVSIMSAIRKHNLHATQRHCYKLVTLTNSRASL